MQKDSFKIEKFPALTYFPTLKVKRSKKLRVCIATLNFTTLSKKILSVQNALRAKWLNPKLIKKLIQKKFLIYFILMEIQKYFLNKAREH